MKTMGTDKTNSKGGVFLPRLFTSQIFFLANGKIEFAMKGQLKA